MLRTEVGTFSLNLMLIAIHLTNGIQRESLAFNIKSCSQYISMEKILNMLRMLKEKFLT